MRNKQAGMSLVEATIIVAVASLLSAIMAPSVRNYVQNAQQIAAKKDVETIGSALTRMLHDVGESFILRSGVETATTDANAHGAPSHATANRVDLLVSEGKVPTVYSGVARVGTDWDELLGAGNAEVQKLDNFLVLNTPSLLTANAYRTAATMDGTLGFDPDSGVAGAGQYTAEYAWRGAYLPGPIGADPWGYRYAVNVEFLARPLGANQGTVNDVYVLSPGNNGLAETKFDIDGVTNVNDIIYVVSGGTR